MEKISITSESVTFPLFVKEVKNGITQLSDGTYVVIIECEGSSLSNITLEEKNARFKTFREVLGSFNFPYALYVQSKRELYEKYTESLATNETDWRKDALTDYKDTIKNVSKQFSFVSKKFFIAIPCKPEHPIDFAVDNQDFESVFRAGLDKMKIVLEGFSYAGIHAHQLDSSECIEFVAETMCLGNDIYKENQKQFIETDKKLSTMAAGNEQAPKKEVTLVDITTPKKSEVGNGTLSIEDVVVRTFELSGGKTDTEEWFSKILFLDRPFMVAFHSIPVATKKKSGFHALITLQGTKEEIADTESTLTSIYATSGITTKVVPDQIAGFLSTRAFLGTDLVSNPDSLEIENVFPFVQESLVGTHGIMYGGNTRVSNLVFLDRFQFGFGPQHSVVLGNNGTGKTYFTKTEAIRYAYKSYANILFVDLFGQYERFAEAFKTPFPVIDMSVEKSQGPFFVQPTKVEIYSFSKITSPDAKIAAVNAFLETLVMAVSDSTLQERCLVVFNELSAGYSNETTLKRIAELMDLHKNSIAVSLVTDNFSYLADSVLGNEIIMNAGLRFIFREESLHEAKRISEYFGIVDTSILQEQTIGEYLLSFGKTVIPIKNIVSYTEDAMFNPLLQKKTDKIKEDFKNEGV